MRTALIAPVFLALVLALAVPCQAKPVRMVFYPNTAELTEQAVLATAFGQGVKTASFRLPSTADPATLRLAGGNDIQDVRWEMVPGREPEAVAGLRAQLDALLAQKDALDAEKQSLDKVAAFWANNVTAKSLPPAQATGLAKAMAQELQDIYKRLPGIDRRMKDLDAAIAVMRRRIDKAAGPWRRQWLVTLTLPAKAPDSITVSWTCMVTGCGWKPIYRLDADPGQKRVAFTFSAEIFQGTGQDIAGADIALATIRPSQRLNPPQLPPWIIRPRSRPEPAPRRAMEAMVMKADDSAPNVMAAAAPEPEIKTSYTLWNLGKKQIPTGRATTVAIQNQEWPADFTWLIRPAVDPVSYLLAKVKTPEPVDLPPGQALHLLEGAMMGKDRFSLAGSEADISFGRDHSVTATEILKAKRSGSKGFLSSDQTMLWSYAIEAKNAKAYPVPARIEEPDPQSRAEKIKLAVTTTPQAETDAKHHLLAWNATLPAKKTTVFSLEVQLTAPEDMPLDVGWR